MVIIGFKIYSSQCVLSQKKLVCQYASQLQARAFRDNLMLREVKDDLLSPQLTQPSILS